MIGTAASELRAYVDYLRDLGIYDVYRAGDPLAEDEIARLLGIAQAPASTPVRTDPTTSKMAQRPLPNAPPSRATQMAIQPQPAAKAPIVQATPPSGASSLPLLPSFLQPPSAKLASFDTLYALPATGLAPDDRASALEAIQTRIGDCTRCPLAYSGRRRIVFGDGDPAAKLMFVGEGPGADEDEQGLPFVGKAGQLLNNMMTAMGLRRDQVYIANIVKCRPPQNRVPEPAEAGTCSQFLVEQIDVVQPQVIVALGATAATYLLGVKQPLASLRGVWHMCRGAKVAVTYHPAFLLRDPRQKGEAWKDLQRVMTELALTPPVKAG